MSHLRVQTPMNIYGVPWLHLDKLQIVSWNFLGHHCIFTFMIFDYLLQPLNKFNKVFVHHCFIFLSHAIRFWGLKFSTRDLLFSNDTILDRNLVTLVCYINICHYKVLIFLNWGVDLKVLLIVSHLCIILFICSCILVVVC
jgi:hypothetical protein